MKAKVLKEIKSKLKSLPKTREELVENLPEYAKNLELPLSEQTLASSLKLDYSTCEGVEREEVFQEIKEFLEKIIYNPEYFLSEEENGHTISQPKIVVLERKSEVVFRCYNVSKRYAKFHLHNVNLELKTGEITGVVGENANGKTTLFRVITGEITPDTGKIEYPSWNWESNFNYLFIKKKIAYVPQELPTWKGNLSHNLYFEAALRGVPKEEVEMRVNYILTRMGLLDYQDKTWAQLSGGYKLRFSLARALVWQPSLLVIDEPLAYLDIKTQIIVLNDIRDLAKSFKNPIAVLISSQHLREVEKIADNLVYLQRGKVIFNGKINDFMKNESEQVFVLDCDIRLNSLKEIFKDVPNIKISYNGFEYILRTYEPYGKFYILETLVKRRVNIKYFRDITRSIERNFK